MALTSRRFSRDERLHAAANNNPALAIGSKGTAVEILQRALIDLDFAMPSSARNDSANPDGIYGSETARVVTKFQVQHGLMRDGVAGRQTIGRLDAIFASREAADQVKMAIEARRYSCT